MIPWQSAGPSCRAAGIGDLTAQGMAPKQRGERRRETPPTAYRIKGARVTAKRAIQGDRIIAELAGRIDSGSAPLPEKEPARYGHASETGRQTGMRGGFYGTEAVYGAALAVYDEQGKAHCNQDQDSDARSDRSGCPSPCRRYDHGKIPLFPRRAAEEGRRVCLRGELPARRDHAFAERRGPEFRGFPFPYDRVLLAGQLDHTGRVPRPDGRYRRV